MTNRAIVAAAAMLATWPATAAGQQYRARLDASVQAVSFRSIRIDSVAADDVVTGASGGPETADGFAVRCTGGAYCFFFRGGPVLRGIPVAATGSVTLWGLGVDGLSVRATGRVLGDLGRDDVWPGVDPPAQLLEGYVEYQRGPFVARGGRQLVSSRLEPIGFDGALVKSHWAAASLDVSGYSGWGLGRATAIIASNPALNPLDDWRPRDRQIVAGAEASWSYSGIDARAEYRREIDPRDGNFVSERAAMSFGARAAGVRAVAGFDYNIAEAHLGSADATLTYVQPRYVASAGVRRYRPYFSLWTLWGAFSPVPYHAIYGSAQYRASDRITVHGRAERYRYDRADISTAIVPHLEDGGWRASTGVSATLGPRWAVDGNYAIEFGPGAAGRFIDAAAEYVPSERYSFGIHGGVLQRPLELRYYEARTGWVGGRADWNATGQRRLWGELSLVDDVRDRPDAGGSSVTQVRLRTGLTVTFGSGTDRLPLPPARRTR